MKAGKKVLYAFVVTMFVAMSLFTSVHAAAITYNYGLRGNGSDDSGKAVVTGRICRLTNNTFYMYIDQGTAYRNITVKLCYMTPGLLGIYQIEDMNYIYNNMLWGNPENCGQMTVSRSLTNYAFSWAGFNGTTDKAYIRLNASGATTAYYFEINNAEFNFASN